MGFDFHLKSFAVTGASSGIGWAVSIALAQRGSHVIAIARNETRLKALVAEMATVKVSESQRFSYEICDVTDCRQLESLAERLNRRGDLDSLIQCAGISYPNYLDAIPKSSVDAVLATNLLAPIHLTRLLLPYFKKRKAGHIAFVGSVSGEINVLGYSVYGASKAGLFAFADSLRNEMVPHGVKVTIIHPPDTATPMLEGEKKLRPEVVQRISEGGGLLSPQTVAASLLKGMAKGRFKIFPDVTSCLLALAFRQFPRLMRWYLDHKVRSLTKAGS